MVYGLIGLGVLAGFCSGMFGIGGGIVLVPGLVFILGFSQHTASGTSLVALLLPVGALGVWQYYVAGKIGPEQIRYGFWIALGMFAGAFLGAKLAVNLPGIWMQRLFSGLLLVAAARLFSQSLG